MKALDRARQYVESWFNLKRYSITADGRIRNPCDFYNDELFDSLWLDYDEQLIDARIKESDKKPEDRTKIVFIAESTMEKAFYEYIRGEKRHVREQIKKSVLCQGENLEPLRVFTRAVIGRDEPLEVAILAHWIWMVKRRITDQSVSNHIMPILCGPQGYGKSEALKMFLAPLFGFTMVTKLDEITDRRNAFALSENYICFCDELEGATRADKDSLKNQITQEYNSVRRLGTNDVFKVKQTCSFIGATDTSLSDKIVDSAGMRRFWEVTIREKLDWETLNKLDYKAVWQGIDEDKHLGYITPYLKNVRKAQEKLRTPDHLEMFILDKNLRPLNEGEKGELILSSSFYTVYKNWAEVNGIHKPLDSIWFGRKLNQKGYKVNHERFNGIAQNVYYLNAESTVPFMRMVRQQ